MSERDPWLTEKEARQDVWLAAGMEHTARPGWGAASYTFSITNAA